MNVQTYSQPSLVTQQKEWHYFTCKKVSKVSQQKDVLGLVHVFVRLFIKSGNNALS